MTMNDAPRTTQTSTEELPPLTAFAWRHGLIRPTAGRMLAGVCGALGRATNTDPVLWRVLLAVLSVVGGIGVIVYVLGWLLLPAEGDSASPVEALLGRGHSATSPTVTVIGGGVVLLAFAVLVTEPLRPGLLSLVLLAAVVLLLSRDRHALAGTVAAGVRPPEPAPPAPPAPPSPPYAGPPRTPPVPPVAPVSRPSRSRLYGLTFSVIVLVLGLLWVADLAGQDIPGPAYIAAALAITGLGLVIGAWVGRACGLIALGLVLVVLLPTAEAVSRARHAWPGAPIGGTITWHPHSLEEVAPEYHQAGGEIILDLTDIDFSAAQDPVGISVGLYVGNLVVIVPPEVDVMVAAKVGVGRADVLGESWDGVGLGERTIRDEGPDGTGGGELRLDASVGIGNLEVHR